MRKIIAQLFSSLDGVVEAPEAWHFDFWSDQMQDAVGDLLMRCDTMLLGRATYEIFAASWPQRDDETPFAQRINAMPKLVVSNTMTEVRWRNSTPIRGDAASALTAVKGREGGDIVLTGSPGLTRSLLAAGVLDRLNLLVHPVVLGSGGRLFADATPNTPLVLERAAIFGTGVLDLTYTPRPEHRPDL
jgi:dihydrofolate reductase